MQKMLDKRQVAVIDDDLFMRMGAQSVFRWHRAIAEPSLHTLDNALVFGPDYWRRFHTVVVDVHDQAKEIREEGTDIYSGVTIIDTIRKSGNDVQILAITPTRANPLLSERLIRSGVDYVHERVDFQRVADLVEAVVNPEERYRPVSHPRNVLIEEGLGHGANPNRAVEIFKASPLYGRVRPGITQAAIGSRRAAISLRDEIIATGFIGRGPAPRWNEVRDYLLKLTGRLPVESRRPPIL
ncbi:MAG: hypothetical protein ACR2QK_12940 [Acidimicrobiales bacterium]